VWVLRPRFIILAIDAKEVVMLSWALTFFIVALIAGVLGFTGIAGTLAGIAEILFFVFLVLFVVMLVMGRRQPPV
jgi:uncharacterized membrane protein YtjA (UPF0391 family)